MTIFTKKNINFGHNMENCESQDLTNIITQCSNHDGTFCDHTISCTEDIECHSIRLLIYIVTTNRPCTYVSWYKFADICER